MCPSLVVVGLHLRSVRNLALDRGGLAQPVPRIGTSYVGVERRRGRGRARVDTVRPVGRGALSPTALLPSKIALGPLALPLALRFWRTGARFVGVLTLRSEGAGTRLGELTAGKLGFGR